MFDIDFSFGLTKQAHGKNWVVLKYLGKDYYLASELTNELPAEVKVIYAPDKREQAAETD